MWTEKVTWFSNEEGKKGQIAGGSVRRPDRPGPRLLCLRRGRYRGHVVVADGRRRQGRVWRRANSPRSTTVAPPPAMPDWSPVRQFGGFAAWKQRRRGRSAPLQQVASHGMWLRERVRRARSRPCARVVGNAPTSDLQGLLGRARLRVLGGLTMRPDAQGQSVLGSRAAASAVGDAVGPHLALGLGVSDWRCRQADAISTPRSLEQVHFGLHPGWLWAALAIVVEIGGSLCVIFNRFVWLGAGGAGCIDGRGDARGEQLLESDGCGAFHCVEQFF